jgi:hypothetical protein
MLNVGVVCFGLVVGYITYRMLVRTTANAAISDLATVIGAIGGGAVTTFVEPGTDLFGWYGVGLLVGFAFYAVLYRLAAGRVEFARTMGRDDRGGDDRDDRSGRPTGAPV